MNFKEYKSGEYITVDNANCLVPSLINVHWTWEDTQVNLLLSKASYYLGVLNTMTEFLPNTRLFVSGSIFREAVKSNEIEGTMTELEDVMGGDNDLDDPKREEVLNYVKAAKKAFDELQDSKGLTEKLLLETHAKIIGKTGVKKSKYKSVQNWIGGATKYDARFIPSPVKEVKNLMTDLFSFLDDDVSDVPDLIKIAIAHYQFETIHPFDDGNGRVGRLLIPMYLMNKKILDYPLFVSRFLADQRRLYYDNLDRVRTDNDLNHWVKFFLVAIKESAKNTIDTIKKVHALMQECMDKVEGMYGGKSGNADELLRFIFTRPTIKSNTVVEALNVSPATANSIIKNFVKAEILIEKTGNQRNREFIFRKYLNILTDIKNE
jgi:Fic family protein